MKQSFRVAPENKENSWLFTLGSKVAEWPNVKNYLFLCPAQTGNGNDANKGNLRTGIKDSTSEILIPQSAKIGESRM